MQNMNQLDEIEERLNQIDQEIRELKQMLETRAYTIDKPIKQYLAHLTNMDQPAWRRILRNIVDSIAQAGDLISFVLSTTALIFYLDANTPVRYPFGIALALLVFILGMILIWWDSPNHSDY